jgi:2-isopropylmalate synthase
MARQIRIFDTTLRDGEQCPGGSMNREEKLTVARMLARLNVDIIEAGFPFSSEDNFEAVRQVAQEVKGPVIAGLARAREGDIDAALKALRAAERVRIHTFLATSSIHMKHKLKMEPDAVFEAAVAAVKYARRFTDDVEFSPEDASRSDPDFLCRVVEGVIDAGATTVNIPDTVGYAIPGEFGALIRMLKARVPNIGRAVISVHCHNDLGLAVANSLAAVAEGAGQVECTINGIGERAGNAALEEIVMALRVRKPYFDAETKICTESLTQASRLVSSITGLVVQPNKAIVGANAFAHEAGIHQDGLLKDKRTYEIMTPESVGLTEHKMVLGRQSGRHAFRSRLAQMGYSLTEEALDRAFERFKHLADQKKEVFDEDLTAIVSEESQGGAQTYLLRSLHYQSGSDTTPIAVIELDIAGRTKKQDGTGDGPVDAVYKTIRAMTEIDCKLLSYTVSAITGGTDAQGEVTVRLEEGGPAAARRTFLGHGADTDIITASAKAYLSALNKMADARRGAPQPSLSSETSP